MCKPSDVIVFAHQLAVTKWLQQARLKKYKTKQKAVKRRKKQTWDERQHWDEDYETLVQVPGWGQTCKWKPLKTVFSYQLIENKTS